MSEKPTNAQLRAIGLIEYYLRIEFEGSSKKEATSFISKHIEESRRAELEHIPASWVHE